MITANDLINQAKTYLSLVQSDQVAALPDGFTQGSYAIASDAQHLIWLNEGQNQLALLCTAIEDTISIPVTTPGQITLPAYATLTNANGRQPHTPLTVSIGTTNLQPANTGFLNVTPNWYPPDPATGNPTAWADNKTAIVLSQDFTSTPTILMLGYFLPTPLVYAILNATVSGTTLTLTSGTVPVSAVHGDSIYISGGSTTAGLYTVTNILSSTSLQLNSAPGNSAANVSASTPLDLSFDEYAARGISYFDAWCVASKNVDNPVLAGRVQVCYAEYVKVVSDKYKRLISNDPTLSQIFSPESIDALVQVVKQITPRN